MPIQSTKVDSANSCQCNQFKLIQLLQVDSKQFNRLKFVAQILDNSCRMTKFNGYYVILYNFDQMANVKQQQHKSRYMDLAVKNIRFRQLLPCYYKLQQSAACLNIS